MPEEQRPSSVWIDRALGSLSKIAGSCRDTVEGQCVSKLCCLGRATTCRMRPARIYPVVFIVRFRTDIENHQTQLRVLYGTEAILEKKELGCICRL